MTQERYDSLDKYYKYIKIFSRTNNFLFWASVIFSYILLYLNNHPSMKYWGNIAFILVTILFFICSNFLNLYLLRRTENKRIIHLLSNSFNIPLDSEETKKYYNNNQEPSILKLGANVFENSLFTSRVSGKMAINNGIVILIYGIIWLLLMANRDTALELLTIIGQTLFSTSIITNWIKLLILHKETERIFEDFRNLFLQIQGKVDIDIVTSTRILDLVIRYECTKASMGINLSSKVFHKINPETSLEWGKIKEKLLID